MAKPSRSIDQAIALRDELRQWKLALGWWSGMPAQEAFELWRTAGRTSPGKTTREVSDAPAD